MISWKIWHALHHPPRHHPAFKRSMTNAYRDEIRAAPGFFMWMFMCSFLTLIAAFIINWLPYFLVGGIILINTIQNARWSFRVSSAIVVEKEHRRYDLLAALPLGLLGTTWAISTGYLHSRASFRWIPYLIQLLAIIIIISMAIIGSLTLLLIEVHKLDEVLTAANTLVLELTILAVPLAILFYIDHVYSCLISILIGLVATIDVREVLEARFRAVMGFLLIQIVSYTLAIGVLLGSSQLLANFDSIRALIITALATMALLIILKDWIIQRLWVFLIHTFNAEEHDVAFILDPVSLMMKK